MASAMDPGELGGDPRRPLAGRDPPLRLGG
jgi:hypothetical protein